jgi:hypothetical protein
MPVFLRSGDVGAELLDDQSDPGDRVMVDSLAGLRPEDPS